MTVVGDCLVSRFRVPFYYLSCSVRGSEEEDGDSEDGEDDDQPEEFQPSPTNLDFYSVGLQWGEMGKIIYAIACHFLKFFDETYI